MWHGIRLHPEVPKAEVGICLGRRRTIDKSLQAKILAERGGGGGVPNMAFVRRRRFVDEAVSNGSADECQEEDGTDSSAEGSPMSSSREAYDSELEMELESMTAKGIKHLCSELLEIKRASEEDFRRNIYLNYLAFIRMFEDAGALEKDLVDLKQHALTQRRLAQDLSNNLYSAILSESFKEIDEMELNVCSSRIFETDTDDTLDILLTEYRMDEALELLEVEKQALENMETQNNSSAMIISSRSAISVKRARVADRFAFLADNPRTPQEELRKALLGLCKLGDTPRANFLLFKFYRSHVIHRVQELRCSKEFLHRNYIRELADTVFSIIFQASRCFTSLHGNASSYASELIQWAREEIEDFSLAFNEYVRSMSEVSDSLVLAVEAVNCALSYCSLLRSLKVFLEADLIELITPSMEEVLKKHAKHLKGVIALLIASDTWMLGRFLISGILRERQPKGAGIRVEHCLLTSSGRKFVTLMHEVVDEVSPLLHLQMENSIFQLLAELFGEYVHALKSAMLRKEDASEKEPQGGTSDQRYMWQFSILINSTTLVSLFPVIVHGLFKGNEASTIAFSTQKERHSLILFTKEVAGQVWTCFRQQFVHDTMSSQQNKPRTSSEAQFFARCLPFSPQSMVPSFAFQVLFLRVRQLNNLSGTILAGEDGTMKKLLEELMEATILWLSENLDHWIIRENHSHVHKNNLSDQVRLDVHFLLEFAWLGGYSSDSIRAAAMDLLTKAEEKAASFEQDANGVMREEEWAPNAAKRALQSLIEPAIDSFDQQEEPNVQDAETLDTGECNIRGHAQTADDNAASIAENNRIHMSKNSNADLHGEQTLVKAGEIDYDDESSLNSSDEYESIEGEDDTMEGGTGDDVLLEQLDLVRTPVVPKKTEHAIISYHESLKDISQEVRDIEHLGADMEVDAALPGLEDSESSDISPDVNSAPLDTRHETAEDDSSSSFTTAPELLQEGTPKAGGADEQTSSEGGDLQNGGMVDEGLVNGMKSTKQTGDFDLATGGCGEGGSPSNLVQRSRRPASRKIADGRAENTGKERGALSRNRPRWH